MPLVQQHIKREINEALTQTKEEQEEQLLVSVSRADETGTSVACTSDVHIFKGLLVNCRVDVHDLQSNNLRWRNILQ